MSPRGGTPTHGRISRGSRGGSRGGTRDGPIMRIAALGDLHVQDAVPEALQRAFTEVGECADVLVLCGDLTDHGLPREAEALADTLSACRLPKIAVLGNHDFESGPQPEFLTILKRSGLVVLSTEPWVLNGVGFVGAKGFAGGFGRLALQ